MYIKKGVHHIRTKQYSLRKGLTNLRNPFMTSASMNL